MSGAKNLKKGEVLFKEGDASDAMYVIKSGKIAIMKSKGTSEIVLAELGSGDMLGEMGFFDNRPRSAGAKAMVDSVIIELPFAALNAQFKTFPEWLKAIVRTVNNHLRNANTKIKNFEKTAADEAEFFSPYLVTRLMGVLGLVAARFGEKSPEGIIVPAGVLRRYTIQIFQQPTAKLQRLMEILQNYGYMKLEDLGEGRQKITVFKLDQILDFVDFYNDWLFKAEDKRVTIDEKDMPGLKALVHYGRKETPNAKGEVKVNLTQMQASAGTEIHQPFSLDDINGLIEKKIIPDKMSGENGITVSFILSELASVAPHWELIYVLKKIQRD
jgi:CRP/FNR family cyclic AMP-dependent transcriptional regulator